jgi:hypothetical protein
VSYLKKHDGSATLLLFSIVHSHQTSLRTVAREITCKSGSRQQQPVHQNSQQTMGSNDKKKRRKRGCSKCGRKKYSSSKWCHCDGFNKSGNCLSCGKSKKRGHPTHGSKRLSLCKIRWLREQGRPYHGRRRDTVDRRHHGRHKQNNAKASTSFALLEQQEFCREITHDGDQFDRSRPKVGNGCVVCGCHRHFDSYGDRTCWCDSCDFDFELLWEKIKSLRLANNIRHSSDDDHGCVVCGCYRHYDSYGDRTCWCDSCDFDFELPWEKIKSLRLANNIRHSSDDDHCEICGCSQHVDDVGDRTCWCDACSQSFPWQSTWTNIVKSKQQSVLVLSPSNDGDSVSHCKQEE